ncbi:MAG: hypothetical protein IT379_11520 [Deltaproteobacteria bacterium]|nr:hypothetical protein [Deltaproteobacteria bacterium]
MQTAQIGGPIGNLKDPVSGQDLPATVSGTFNYELANPNAGQMLPQAQAALVRATGMVVAAKIAANQVAIPTLAASLPHFYNEIATQSGVYHMGIHIHGMDLTVNVATAPPLPGAGIAPGAMPMNPMEATKAAFAQKAKDALDPSNYEVRARVDVGGFRIKASTDGGLDTDSLKEQVTEKAKSTVIWWAIGCVIIGIVLVGALGLGIYIWLEIKKTSSGSTSTDSSEATAATWDGTAPYSCGGNENVRIENVTATFAAGTAISAGGSCQLTLVNVNVTAPTALSAGANARVTVTGGSLTGTEHSVSALGASQVTMSGTRVTGPTQRLGAATITGP